jgi:hypothetical protein
MLRLFSGDGGGLFDTGNDAEAVLVRGKDCLDGAIPSGNAMAALVLVRLGRITDDGAFTKAGRGIIRAFLDGAFRQPAAYIQLLAALAELLTDPLEVTISPAGASHDVRQFLMVLGRRLTPGLVLRAKEGVQTGSSPGAGAVAHVCAGGACLPPVTDPASLDELLDPYVILPPRKG